MRSVAEFYQDCLQVAHQQDPLGLLLSDAVGCVLAEDVVAPQDHPATDVAALDGYAVRSTDLRAASKQNPARLTVTAEISPGDANPAGLAPAGAMRIASGATMPVGADSVVPLEHTDHGHNDVRITKPTFRGENVRARGEDVREGEKILSQHTRLGPAQIAAVAAVGKARVNVHPRPRVVFISVGDELVEPGTRFREGRVYDANGQALAAAATEAGAEAFRCAPIPDDRNALRELIDDQLMRADLIITTGGISYGSANTVREVLSPAGTVRFDQVAIAPRAMLGVGTVEPEGDVEHDPTPIFCLPGDPVAAQTCFEVFVRPALRRMLGWKQLSRPGVKAAVTQGFSSPPGVRQFVGCKLKGDPRTGYEAEVVGRPEATWVSSFASSNALIVVPEGVTNVTAGSVFTCMLLE